jgi:hypothetical protein
VGEDLNTFWVTRGSRREEEYADKNLRPTFKSGRTTVGVWSCFCGDEMGPLYMLLECDGLVIYTSQSTDTVAKNVCISGLYTRRSS